jgi:hypothetical protein
MTKCLSCGYLRADLELNCPNCGSFYSSMADEFSTDDLKREKLTRVLLTKIKVHLEHPKHRLMAVGMVSFLVIVVIFL